MTVLLWTLPVFFFISRIFLDSLLYFYNPEVFFCNEQVNSKVIIALVTVIWLVVPFTIIIDLNWKVFKTANDLQIKAVAARQPGRLDSANPN